MDRRGTQQYRYQAVGARIVLTDRTGDTTDVATCRDTVAAGAATVILNRAADQQDKSHYTAAARLSCQAESLPGFKYVAPFGDA